MKEAIDYMKSKRLMQLATSSDKPWICTVFYAMDDDHNLYFVSEPATRHCSDISTNPNVACAITDTSHKVLDNKKGVQIEGTASEVTDEEEMKRALDLWNSVNHGVEEILNFGNMKSNGTTERVFKIVPKSIKFFNEELYGEEGTETFKV